MASPYIHPVTPETSQGGCPYPYSIINIILIPYAMTRLRQSFPIFILAILAITFSPVGAPAQILVPDGYVENTDSIKKSMDIGPFFGLYKDNYFALGTDPFHTPDKYNSGIKFQLSISQRLTNATLPWDTYVYLFFTQKVFWEIFQESMPMSCLIYTSPSPRDRG